MSKNESDERQDSIADHPEAVGYCKPPTRRQFKDFSGNPKGRPKGAKNRKTIVQEIASEMHGVIENGKHRRRSTLHLILLRLRNLAMEGKNIRAFEQFQKLIERYEPQETRDDVGYLVVPAEMTPEEWVAKAEEENKTRKPPRGLKGSH